MSPFVTILHDLALFCTIWHYLVPSGIILQNIFVGILRILFHPNALVASSLTLLIFAIQTFVIPDLCRSRPLSWWIFGMVDLCHGRLCHDVKNLSWQNFVMTDLCYGESLSWRTFVMEDMNHGHSTSGRWALSLFEVLRQSDLAWCKRDVASVQSELACDSAPSRSLSVFPSSHPETVITLCKILVK